MSVCLCVCDNKTADELHITPIVESPHVLLEEELQKEKKKEERDRALAHGRSPDVMVQAFDVLPQSHLCAVALY